MITTTPTYGHNTYKNPSYFRVETLAEEIEDAAKRRSKTRVVQSITGLCASCTHAFIYRTRRENEPTVVCMNFSTERRMPTDIEECSRYSAIGQLDISTLAKMATLIDKDEKDQAGFKVTVVGG